MDKSDKKLLRQLWLANETAHEEYMLAPHDPELEWSYGYYWGVRETLEKLGVTDEEA